jgi:uncharacterized protein (TIRG00374 family)
MPPMLRVMVRRWGKFAIALAGSLFFSVLFLRSTNLDEVWRALTGANYLYVVPALALFALSVVARSVRWQVMYRPDREYGWRFLLPSLLVGYAGNNLLPLRAGEILRAQHVGVRTSDPGPSVPWMVSFGTFIMERIFDFMVLSAFVLWGILIVHEGGAYLGIALLLAGGTATGLVVAVFLALNPGLPARLLARPWPLLSEGLRSRAAGMSLSFLDGFSCLTTPSRFVLVALATAAAWGLELAMYFVIGKAFALEAGFVKIAFAGAAANVAMSVPSAQGGVGPFQYLAREALGKAGVAGGSAGAYALALHVFLVGPVSLVGLVVLWRSTLSRGATMAAAKISASEVASARIRR